jgi:hypothetical protein
MARELVFNHHGEISHMALAKIDRARLYGRKVRMVTDEDGTPCTPAFLSRDGHTLVPSGGLAMTYLDETGDSVDRAELQVLDQYGEVLDKLPSTLGIEHELFGPVAPERVLDHRTTAVYLLDDDGIGDDLGAALDRGEIFEGEFRYTAGVHTHTLFLLRNGHGTFALIGQPIECAFIGPDQEQTGADIDGEDDTLDDDLDFSF